MPDLDLAYRELFVCWAGVPAGTPYDVEDGYELHEEHTRVGECEYGWACNSCGVRVDDRPCPAHAPSSVPGLRLVECAAEPKHILFAHDRDDYGHFCPWCEADRLRGELKPLKEAAERRAHRWCWLLNRLKRAAVRLHIARPHSYSGGFACWHVDIRWRWS